MMLSSAPYLQLQLEYNYSTTTLQPADVIVSLSSASPCVVNADDEEKCYRQERRYLKQVSPHVRGVKRERKRVKGTKECVCMKDG